MSDCGFAHSTLPGATHDTELDVAGPDSTLDPCGSQSTHGAEAAITRYVSRPSSKPWHATLGRQELSQRWTPAFPLGHILSEYYTKMLSSLTAGGVNSLLSSVLTGTVLCNNDDHMLRVYASSTTQSGSVVISRDGYLRAAGRPDECIATLKVLNQAMRWIMSNRVLLRRLLVSLEVDSIS